MKCFSVPGLSESSSSGSICGTAACVVSVEQLEMADAHPVLVATRQEQVLVLHASVYYFSPPPSHSFFPKLYICPYLQYNILLHVLRDNLFMCTLTFTDMNNGTVNGCMSIRHIKK